jgi:hypothetical protein
MTDLESAKRIIARLEAENDMLRERVQQLESTPRTIDCGEFVYAAAPRVFPGPIIVQ